MPDRKPARAFPFPFAEDEAQTRWWAGMQPYEQKRWFALVSAMTASERAAFHAERREIAGRFRFAEGTPWRANEEFQAEGRLLNAWTAKVRARRAAP